MRKTSVIDLPMAKVKQDYVGHAVAGDFDHHRDRGGDILEHPLDDMHPLGREEEIELLVDRAHLHAARAAQSKDVPGIATQTLLVDGEVVHIRHRRRTEVIPQPPPSPSLRFP